MRRATAPLIVLVAALALVVAGCGTGADDDAGAGGMSPTSDTQAVICPEGAGERGFNANTLVGLAVVEAERRAAKYDCTVRPVKVDGESLAVTMDFRPDRVNVEVEEDKVTAVEGVY